MDLERQPLLRHTSDVRCRRLRPLTSEEIITTRQDIRWRRTRFCLIFMFWILMVMFLSMIACIIITSQCKDKLMMEVPSVPPVHMTLTPLIYLSDPVLPDDRTYTL